MRVTLLALYGLVAFAAAAPAPASGSVSKRHVVHEKRTKIPANWRRTAKLHPKSTVPMRIGLTQSNLDKGEELLLDISHPDSPNYGKHWSPQRIAEAFAPTEEAIEAIGKWLEESGITDFKQSKGLNWIDAEVTVEEAERLLQTTYHEYEHASGKKHVACEHYSVPEEIQEYIDIIVPTLHFDAKVEQPKKRSIPSKPETPDSSAAGPKVIPGAAKSIGQPGSGVAWPKKGATVSKFNIASDSSQCNERITPDCLRALYNIPSNSTAAPGNSYGIVEYTPQAFIQTDLDTFFANYSPAAVGAAPTLVSIDGGYLQQEVKSFNYNGESNLDLEYAMSLVYPQNVTLYQVGDDTEGASFGNFLDALDASYCTYDGGDDPNQDSTYPDPYGGYTGPEACGTVAPAKVISTSYGSNEADLTPFYEKRQCNEYLKLGLQGTTFLYSSGDNGVAGNENKCIDPTSGNYTSSGADYGMFNPSFPGTCPYVLSIGATQVKPSVTNVSTTQPEQAAESVIYSGGGFSNVFALPSYQSSTVSSYFAKHNPPYGADRYNNSMQTRGYPDVSANGVNYFVAVDGNYSLVFGTSASSPTFGSLLTLINAERLKVNKSSVGFVNPTFYQYPDILTDITDGGNQGCGTPGFSAVEGWDPVTGLGTPNYPAMLSKFLSLP
ncbi:MAG: hypothetical protein M1818_005678 [Claussenomyces sp. TS43310]|nr:MAG: hypothetical protein M1818_005678 [Claussenomyces sp. TS43310]